MGGNVFKLWPPSNSILVSCRQTSAQKVKDVCLKSPGSAAVELGLESTLPQVPRIHLENDLNAECLLGYFPTSSFFFLSEALTLRLTLISSRASHALASPSPLCLFYVCGCVLFLVIRMRVDVHMCVEVRRVMCSCEPPSEVLGIQLWSSVRAVLPLNCSAIS